MSLCTRTLLVNCILDITSQNMRCFFSNIDVLVKIQIFIKNNGTCRGGCLCFLFLYRQLVEVFTSGALIFIPFQSGTADSSPFFFFLVLQQSPVWSQDVSQQRHQKAENPTRLVMVIMYISEAVRKSCHAAVPQVTRLPGLLWNSENLLFVYIIMFFTKLSFKNFKQSFPT